MAANKRTSEHEAVPSTPVEPISDSLMVIPVDDGETGRYVLIAIPAFSADFEAAYHMGVRYEAIRSAQGEAKKAKKANKDVAGALATWASAFKPTVTADRLGTVGTMRAEIASEMVKAALAERGKPTHEANVLANVPGYMTRHADKIDSALRSKLAAGYTPSRKGEGAKATGTAAVEEDL